MAASEVRSWHSMGTGHDTSGDGAEEKAGSLSAAAVVAIVLAVLCCAGVTTCLFLRRAEVQRFFSDQSRFTILKRRFAKGGYASAPVLPNWDELSDQSFMDELDHNNNPVIREDCQP
eukprot:gene17538-26988_t